MRSADPLTRSLTAAGWIGLVLFLCWYEFFAEVEKLAERY